MNSAKRNLSQSLSNLITSKSQVYLWKLKQGNLQTLPCLLVGKDQFHLKLEISPFYISHLESFIGGSGQLNFISHQECLMWKSEYRQVSQAKENLELLISIPTNDIFYERREFARYEFLAEKTFSIKKGDKIVKKQCHDISAGGFSVLMTSQEETFFKGEGFELLTSEKAPALKLKLTALKKMKPFELEKNPYALARVSFEFVDINDEWKKSIESFIKLATQNE